MPSEPNNVQERVVTDSLVVNERIILKEGAVIETPNGTDIVAVASDGASTTITGTETIMDDAQPAAAAQEEVVGTGAISVATYLTTIDTTAGATNYTLANGTALRQRKKILLRVDNGDATVTGAFAGAATTLTFANAGEYALLEWNGTDWIALELSSVLDMTHAPVIS